MKQWLADMSKGAKWQGADVMRLGPNYQEGKFKKKSAVVKGKRQPKNTWDIRILSRKHVISAKRQFTWNEIEEGKTLQNINLKFEGGKMTSLVGHSGSGKSTILNLIPRIYEVQSGDILIDNQSIYKTTIKSLRNEISMVSQETTLFDDTIKNNIKYGRENATDEEIIKAAKLSYCDDFINKLPNKYKTFIGENGVFSPIPTIGLISGIGTGTNTLFLFINSAIKV